MSLTAQNRIEIRPSKDAGGASSTRLGSMCVETGAPPPATIRRRNQVLAAVPGDPPAFWGLRLAIPEARPVREDICFNGGDRYRIGGRGVTPVASGERNLLERAVHPFVPSRAGQESTASPSSISTRLTSSPAPPSSHTTKTAALLPARTPRAPARPQAIPKEDQPAPSEAGLA